MPKLPGLVVLGRFCNIIQRVVAERVSQKAFPGQVRRLLRLAERSRKVSDFEGGLLERATKQDVCLAKFARPKERQCAVKQTLRCQSGSRSVVGYLESLCAADPVEVGS